MRTLAAALLAIGAVLLGAAVVVWLVVRGAGEIPPATVDFDALAVEERAALVDRGRYVARAADCGACHVGEDGVTMAGGLPMETPFGTIYGTNITPSRTHGIGGWSADDLYRATVYGVEPDGTHLYPAMPYTSYHAMSRAEIDALWLYLMSLPPVEKPNRELDMMFPFNIRPAIAFWNMLFRPDPGPLPAAPGKSDEWVRGRHLVDVLGHCGECHTPRNLAYARTDAHLRGEVMEGALSPDITPQGLAERGWTPADLAAFMKTGLAPQGTMTFRMYPVLVHSSRYLTETDIDAMVAYLMDGAPEGAVRPATTAGSDAATNGRRLYVGLCAGCHGSDGEGRPHASVPLDTNTTAMLDDPLNLVRVILEGIPARDFTGGDRMQAMPAFRDRLSDAETADLVNYLRTRWGGLEGDVDADQVAAIRDR